MIDSGIYVGTLRHRRFAPRPHEFTYPLFMVLLDIDRIPELMRISALSSYNRWNWISYQERDHFGDPFLSLRSRVEADAQNHAAVLPGGKIFLLTHLRYLGYNFNPVSFFYCLDADGSVHSVLAEVSNTFGETHNYWLTPGAQVPTGSSKRYRFDKRFHVSPFLGMHQQYDWTFNEPGNRLVVESMNFEDGKLVFDSTLSLDRREWTAAELHRSIARYPMVTAKVVAAIHWQAVRLMLKRVPVVQHPGAGKFAPSATKHIGAAWKI